MEATSLVGLLAEPERLRVVAALALGAEKFDKVLRLSGLDARSAAQALRRLESGGLVSTVDSTIILHAELFGQAARVAAPEPDDHGVGDPAEAAVLRAFLRDGRLVQIPSAYGKLQIVLHHLVMVFEPGIRYAEREVNVLLSTFHPDYAALRRYLVDEGLLSRDAGVYWRTGGWIDG